jgi:hypothetical protein
MVDDFRSVPACCHIQHIVKVQLVLTEGLKSIDQLSFWFFSCIDSRVSREVPIYLDLIFLKFLEEGIEGEKIFIEEG